MDRTWDGFAHMPREADRERERLRLQRQIEEDRAARRERFAQIERDRLARERAEAERARASEETKRAAAAAQARCRLLLAIVASAKANGLDSERALPLLGPLCLGILRVGVDPDGMTGLRHVAGRSVMVDLDADPELIATSVEGLRIFAGEHQLVLFARTAEPDFAAHAR